MILNQVSQIPPTAVSKMGYRRKKKMIQNGSVPTRKRKRKMCSNINKKRENIDFDFIVICRAFYFSYQF